MDCLIVELVKLVLTAGIGYFFVEKWQRWRQRRDFQMKVLTQFSQKTSIIFHDLHLLYAAKGKYPPEKFQALRLDFTAKKTLLQSLDGEIPVYESDLVLQGLFDIVGQIERISSQYIDKYLTDITEFDKAIKCFAQARKQLMELMLKEMRLL